MKKYLMTGIAALGMGSLFTSCGPDMSVYNVSQSEQVLQKYEQSFVQAFGEPAPTQTWGFGSSTVAGTRGTTRAVGDYDGYIGTLQPVNVSFPTDNQYGGLVSSNNIHVSSTCPHHLVVVDYNVSLAYVPNNGRYIGLSKLPRLARTLAKSMCLQEDYTKKLVDVLDSELKPMGCAAMVTGIHNCIQARGAEMRDVQNTTIELRGIFQYNPSLKEEWLFTIKNSAHHE